MRQGERIALLAPSGAVAPAARFDQAQTTVREMGFEPVLMPHARGVHGHMAGNDAERAADFNAAVERDDIAALWCLRGGAGALRLLPLLNYAALRARPKPVIGYSDTTAIHAAIGRCAGVVSFLGPIAVDCTDAAERAALLRCLGLEAPGVISLAGERCTCVRSGEAVGPLIGGNLTVLLRTLGTPYEPDFTGAILLLEDVAEAPYRVDNMLTQLRLSGRLQSVAGIVFGTFTGWVPDAARPHFEFAQVIEERCGDLGVPVMSGLRSGHNGTQVTLPLGHTAVMNAGAGTLVVPTPAVC